MHAQVKHEGNRLLVLVRDVLPACPKCGTTRLERPACPRCGLATARMDAYRASRDAAVPDAVQRAWQLATVRWADARAHDDLLELAMARDASAWIAARYRERAAAGDATAEVQLARIRRAAEATLAVRALARTEVRAEPRPYRALVILLAILGLALFGGWLYARTRTQPAPTPPAAGAPAPTANAGLPG